MERSKLQFDTEYHNDACRMHACLLAKTLVNKHKTCKIGSKFSILFLFNQHMNSRKQMQSTWSMLYQLPMHTFMHHIYMVLMPKMHFVTCILQNEFLIINMITGNAACLNKEHIALCFHKTHHTMHTHYKECKDSWNRKTPGSNKVSTTAQRRR